MSSQVTQTSLTVVIPSHNRPREIKQCIHSVLSQEIPSGLDLSILVRENSSCQQAKSEINRIVEAARLESEVPIELLNISTTESVLEGDHNIYESIRVNSSDYVLVLPDDDFLLNGSLSKIYKAVVLYKPDLIHLRLIQVTNANSDYIQRNYRVPDYDAFDEFNFLDYDFGLFIGLQSFVFSPKALAASDAPSFSDCSGFINWTCASQFFAMAVNSEKIIEIVPECVAWRRQQDTTNLSVRLNWDSINLFQSARLLKHFLQKGKISFRDYLRIRDRFLFDKRRLPHLPFLLKKFFAFADLYGLKNTIIMMPFSALRTIKSASKKLIGYSVKYVYAILRVCYNLKESIIPSSPLFATLPLGALSTFNRSQIVEPQVDHSSSSYWWQQHAPQYSSLSLYNFRRQHPVVGIMQGNVAREKFSKSIFLKELLSCPVGTLFLSRVSDSPLGQPPLRFSFPLISSLTALHVWYWYKLCMFDPMLEDIQCDVHEFGGGFGNLAKVILCSTQQIKNYFIYDFPTIAPLQKAFLSTSLPGQVNKKIICAGLYNHNFADSNSNVPSSRSQLRLFVATFSLSETDSNFFRSFLRGQLFDYDYALIAFQHHFEGVNNLGIVQDFLRDDRLVSESICELIEMWNGASLLLFKK